MKRSTMAGARFCQSFRIPRSKITFCPEGCSRRKQKEGEAPAVLNPGTGGVNNASAGTFEMVDASMILTDIDTDEGGTFNLGFEMLEVLLC